MDQRDREEAAREPGQDSARREPAPDAVETRTTETRPVPRRSSNAWLYAIPVVALIVAGTVWMLHTETTGSSATASVAVGTSGERSRGQDPEGARSDQPLNPVPQGPRVIADAGLLSQKDQYVGRAVRFSAVPVFSTEGPRTFWVGRIGARALVLADPGISAPQVRSGEMVEVEGTLEQSPDDATLERSRLADDDREAVEGEDIIIRATRVRSSSETGSPEERRHR